jgi:hypothetical protein
MTDHITCREHLIVTAYALAGALSVADAIAPLTAAYNAKELTLTGWLYHAFPTTEASALAMSGALPSELA